MSDGNVFWHLHGKLELHDILWISSSDKNTDGNFIAKLVEHAHLDLLAFFSSNILA